ncbi:sugar phosphate isomerase/epimerase [Pseudorhizobium endolithicum]|uniref:Sugar phosphate isomerase/epimerase n=1 Tax=Pseudorhizobium endolithicum TaxID=1191678 RepID=A0ABN7JYG6_9HYPH|nr:sugar phosphate isomerase/epimerase family protein [Pseudorhizobium endolithicum]CAD7049687.1 sugar phosphate isomerase/epimerase [Pseudorhizobium endolithicum]
MDRHLSTARAPTINTYGFLWSHRADDAVRLLLQEGYREFELMLQPPHLSLDPQSPEGQAIRSMVDDGAIVLHSLNMPSLDTNLASAMPEMRAYSIEMFVRQIRLAGALGARNLVIAPGRVSPLFPAPAELLRQWLADALDVLLPVAREEGIVLALENLPIAALPRATDLLGFLECLGSPSNLGICYDAANAHYVAEDPLEGLLLLRNHLQIIHFSDTRRDRWRHDVIGEGEIGFQRICDLLDELGWEGPLVIEIISRASDPLEAITRSHSALANGRHGFGLHA